MHFFLNSLFENCQVSMLLSMLNKTLTHIRCMTAVSTRYIIPLSTLNKAKLPPTDDRPRAHIPRRSTSFIVILLKLPSNSVLFKNQGSSDRTQTVNVSFNDTYKHKKGKAK